MAGISFSRNGFGVNLVKVKKVKLTPSGANALNKAIGISASKPVPFLKNKLNRFLKKYNRRDSPDTVTTWFRAATMTFRPERRDWAKKLSDVKAEVTPN